MLTIVVAEEGYDEEKGEFTLVDPVTLELEHSLASLSKWEMIFEKPFLVPGDKTSEEVLEYIKCMTITPNIPPEVFDRLSMENLEEINKYIEKKQTATWFNDRTPTKPSPETVTSELIYYWLTAFKIPLEVQYWNLNRLFTLLRVCEVKNSKPKQMTEAEILAQNRELNAQRRAQLGSTG